MSDTSTAVLLVAVVAVLLGTGVATVGQAYEDTPTHVDSVGNEAVTIDFDQYRPVSKSGDTGVTGFYDNESVYNESGTELTEGTDYDWNASDGTILFYNTSSTTEGAEGNMSYAYDTRPDSAVRKIGPLATVFEFGSILPLVVMAGAAFYGLKLLWSARGAAGGTRRR